RPVYDELCRALQGIDWEAIFVDDDSEDGTPEAVCRLVTQDRRVRCIQRIGRRGLASACVEGILASSAPYVAVMDADRQHVERLLPRMIDILKSGPIVDVVVGSRYARRLTGWKFVRGPLSFALICSFGAVANVGIATLLFTERHAFWWAAGIAGAAMSVVWNYAVTSALTWRE